MVYVKMLNGQWTFGCSEFKSQVTSLAKPVKTGEPPNNSMWHYLNEIPPHFIQEIKAKGNDIDHPLQKSSNK